MEIQQSYNFIEQARNAAIEWIEKRAPAAFGPYRKIEIGRLGVLKGKEVGVSAAGAAPFWRLRLDYDPGKGAHFNAEVGTGPGRQKAAFTFPGGEELIKALAAGLSRR